MDFSSSLSQWSISSTWIWDNTIKAIDSCSRSMALACKPPLSTYNHDWSSGQMLCIEYQQPSCAVWFSTTKLRWGSSSILSKTINGGRPSSILHSGKPSTRKSTYGKILNEGTFLHREIYLWDNVISVDDISILSKFAFVSKSQFRKRSSRFTQWIRI